MEAHDLIAFLFLLAVVLMGAANLLHAVALVLRLQRKEVRRE